MIKQLLLSLLSMLFMAPASLNGVTNVLAENNIIENNLDPDNEDVLHGYTYDIEQESSTTRYVFHSDELGPGVNKYFSAPAGYKYFLEFDEEKATEVVDQMVFFGDKLMMTYVVVKYTLNGAEVDLADAYFPCDGTKEGQISNLVHVLDGAKFLDVIEIDFDAVVVPFIDVHIGTGIVLRFFGKPLEIHPFGEFDFVSISGYYLFSDDFRPMFNFHAKVLDGFFNENPNYNPYGYKTDETMPIYDDVMGENAYRCKYELQLLAYDSIPLGNIDPRYDGTNAGLSISLPDEPMYVKVRLQFVANGERYTFYSRTLTIEDSDVYVHIDEYDIRTSVPRGTEHYFDIYSDKILFGDFEEIKVILNAVPDRLIDDELGYELYGDKTLPEVGEEGKFYYEPSLEEKELYNAGNYEELESMSAQGTYKLWDTKTESYKPYKGLDIINNHFNRDQLEGITESQFKSLFKGNDSFPYAGRWRFEIDIHIACNVPNAKELDGFEFQTSSQTIDVINTDGLGNHIEVNVPDSFNLIRGAGEIDIRPHITGDFDSSSFYYDWTMSKTGIVEIEEEFRGKILINPINTGIVTLKVTCESEYFNKLTKEINIRVLDNVYGVAKMVVPDGFHYANEDLTVSIDVRGFTKFLNLDINWSVTNKKGEAVDSEKYVDNGDATLTLLKPESNDYTIKATYEDIELDAITLEVRKININAFLSQHIWWIVLMTAGLVVLAFLFSKLTKAGKTTVQHIERVYGVFCACLSNDELSKSELKRIRREILRCLRRCEDQNIEAFNQYEKSIRYLRKSLNDTKELYIQFDKMSAEEKSVYTERLDKDLSKALNVAKEIEYAKQLVDDYHLKANHHNFETNNEDEPKK